MIDPQRGTDLLRYARHFLFDAGLISQNELAGLQMHEGAVPRLEGYDATRRDATIETLEALPHYLVHAENQSHLCARCKALDAARKESA